jgi:5'-nucleotidase/UDP-sugar diphosphatase
MFSRLRKTCLITVLAVVLALAGGTAFGQENGVLINGRPLNLPSSSLVNDNGRLLVPGDVWAKALGASFYECPNGELILEKSSHKLTFNASSLMDNEKPVPLESVPQYIEGRWLIPLRVTAELLDCAVEWNPSAGTALVWGPTGDVVALDVLGISDFHGALEESGKDPGFAKLGGFLRDQQAKNPQGTLILSGGDMFQGSLLSTVSQGRPVIAAMNATGFDVMAIGNHEFDWGYKILQEQAGQAEFPFLAANLFDTQTGEQPDGIEPYIIIERQGVKLSIIGLVTTETLEIVHPGHLAGLEIRDPAEVLKTLVPEMRQQGAEVIIVLSHLGCSPSDGGLTGEAVELVKAVPDIDALLTAHTHLVLEGEIDGVPVTQAGHNGRAAASIRLLYSQEQDQVIKSLTRVTELIPANLTPDPEIAAIIDGYTPEIQKARNEVIGKNLYDLHHERYQVSSLGSFISDVIREATVSDIAFLNGGGVRTDLMSVKVTLEKIWEIVPFDNTLVTLDMTGEEILQVLEYGIMNQTFGSVQFSGLKVWYDANQPAGKRVTRVTLPDNTPLEAASSYRVVINDFMAGGGDGYTMFKEAGPQVNTGIVLRDMLIDRIKALGTIEFKGDTRFVDVNM